MSTLFEQYKAAEEEWAKTHSASYLPESQEERNRYCELRAIIETEGLRLERAVDGGYVVCTIEGDEVTDVFDDLDDVESWLDDPGFLFDRDEELTVSQIRRMVDRLKTIHSADLLADLSTVLLNAAARKKEKGAECNVSD